MSKAQSDKLFVRLCGWKEYNARKSWNQLAEEVAAEHAERLRVTGDLKKHVIEQERERMHKAVKTGKSGSRLDSELQQHRYADMMRANRRKERMRRGQADETCLSADFVSERLQYDCTSDSFLLQSPIEITSTINHETSPSK